MDTPVTPNPSQPSAREFARLKQYLLNALVNDLGANPPPDEQYAATAAQRMQELYARHENHPT